MAEEGVVGQRDQRRSLAARRHVPVAELGDGEDASALDDDRGLADLERGPVLRLVGEGLAVGGDGVGGLAHGLDDGQRRLGEHLAEADVQSGDLGSPELVGGESGGAEASGQGVLEAGHHLHGHVRNAPGQADGCRGHGIGGGAGHEADQQAR